jgi:hypothetical protein
MKSKIFNAQEVQSMISGNKTQFREVIKPLSKDLLPDELGSYAIRGYITPPYQVGQKIFCKEKFKVRNEGIYYSDFTDFTKSYLKVSPWMPAQRMKQEHSRLTLQIKEIRVERLQNITPFDCVCEGVWDGRNVMLGMSGKAVEAFKDYWNKTHKKPEEKFEESPWVWCVSFGLIND